MTQLQKAHQAEQLVFTLSALGVKGSSRVGFAEAEFSLLRMFTSRGLRKPARLLVRGVELSTADMRAAFALRLTTDGLRLRRSSELHAFLADLRTAPDLLALGPADVQLWGEARLPYAMGQEMEAGGRRQAWQHPQCSPGVILSRRGYRGETCAAGFDKPTDDSFAARLLTSDGCLNAERRLRFA